MQHKTKTKTKAKIKKTSVSIDKELADALRNDARADGRSVSGMIRKITMEFIAAKPK